MAVLIAALPQTGCLSLSGSLTGSQTSLSFGNVAIGSISKQSLTLTNSGAAAITVTKAVASGGGFTVTGPPLPLTLAVGQSATFIARFAPPAVGNASGRLLITKTQVTVPQLTGGSGSATPSVTTSLETITMTGEGVSQAPAISTQPASQKVTAGQTATFSVTSSGAAPLSYQWSKNGAAVSGATSASYTTPATATSDSGSQFTVVVSNSAGSVTSNAATLTVTTADVTPSISMQPASQTVAASQTAIFQVTASGTAPLSYQWRKNGTAITGATSASYTTAATATSDSGSQFTVVVSNSAGSVTSNAATLTVTTAAGPPSITTQPANQMVTVGQMATFSVTASGTSPLNYQWRKNGTAINSATSSSYTTPATAISDSASQFSVVVSNSTGSMTSNAATLTVTAAAGPPSITTQPANQMVTVGQSATFSVTASGTSPLNYQWRKNGTAINSATSSSYTTAATAISDSGSAFTVAISSSTGSVTSNTATLTVSAPLVTIAVTPNNATMIVGSTQQFSANVTGTSNTAVTWSVSGVGCTGGVCGMISANGLYTSPSSVPSPATVTVKATSVADPTKSASASVTVAAALAVLLSISPTSASVSTSGMQLFTASVTGTSNTAVTWGLSGAGCTGSTCGTLATSSLSAVYSAPSVAPSPTNVSVVATSVADPAKSASANLTIVPNVLVSVTPTNVSLQPGATLQFSAAVTGTSNTGVGWIVSGSGCSGTACGTIDSSGRYAAPSAVPSPPTVTVTATSIADPTKSGASNVTLGATVSTNVTVTVQPNGSITAPYSPLLLLRGATKRLYANVCNGSNTLDCARPTDITVIWQASCGALNAVTGPYVDYTAPNSGGPCTITATNQASGAAATATATLANPPVSIDVIPAAITLYKNQYALLQAVVTGSVNRDVTWSLTTNPGNAGTLTLQGWTATFSASAPGSYAATATSNADGTKTAVITLYVTSNAMPLTATANHTEPVDCTPTGSGKTYEVGPARALTTINAVPWNSLMPGDTVRIHNDGINGSPTTYNEKWLIKQSGTVSEPIRVCGVPNVNGELPVISGNGATTATGYDYGVIEDRGLIVIYNHTAAYGNNASYPRYITIEGLKFTNVTGAFSFVSRAGGSTTWPNYGAAIWEQHGGHVILRGNDVEGTNQSIFINAQSPESSMSRWLLIEGNYIGSNGVVGQYLYHQTYAQAFGQVIQGNYYDEPLPGMSGSQVKERCVECFTRYNYVSATVAGARVFDIVAPESSNCLAVVQQFYYQGGAFCGNSADTVAATEDWYGTDYVYGNIVKFAQPLSPIHYGDDNCAEYSHGGTLYVYHNTFWETGDVNYRWNLFDTGPGGSACHSVTPITGYAGGRYTNNAVKLSIANDTVRPFFFWASSYSSFLQLDANWISSSWGSSSGQGADGDGTAYSHSFTSIYQTGNDAHHIAGIGSLITGTGIPFDTSTFAPTTGSPLIGAAAPLPAAVSSALPVTMQYNPSTYSMTPRMSATDIGAVKF
jgi:hypothetical protein